MVVCTAYYNTYVVPKERTLREFNKLKVKDFQRPFFTIAGLNLPPAASYCYTWHFLNTRMTYVGDSTTGKGLFAKEDIDADVPILECCGERVSTTRAKRRAINYQSQGISGDYMSACDDNTFIDATFAGNTSRYLNHSCRPNVLLDVVLLPESNHTVTWLYSTTCIKVNTQLTTNYHFNRVPTEPLVPCKCGFPECGGWQ